MSYSARRHSAVQAVVSSTIHAARGSPSRGWPVDPGFSSHSPAREVEQVAGAPRRARRRLALGPVERERHVRVADQRDAVAVVAGGVQAELGGQAGEHVLPDRVARGGVVEADGLGLARRREPEQELARLGPDHVPRPLGGERRAAREVLQRQHVDDGEVVVAGEADRAVGLGQRDARVGLGAVADEVAEAPQLLDLRPPAAAAITASNACLLPWMSDAIATRMPRVCSVRRSWRLPVALVTAVVVAEAAVLVMRPRDRGPEPVAGRGASLLQRRRRSRRPRRSARGQLWIYLAQTAVGLGVLVLIVRRPPRAARRRSGDRCSPAPRSRRRSRVATGVAALPLSAVARERAKDVGLVTQDWVG